MATSAAATATVASSNKEAWANLPDFVQRLVAVPNDDGPKLLYACKLELQASHQQQSQAEKISKKINQNIIINAMAELSLRVPQSWDLVTIGSALKSAKTQIWDKVKDLDPTKVQNEKKAIAARICHYFNSKHDAEFKSLFAPKVSASSPRSAANNPTQTPSAHPTQSTPSASTSSSSSASSSADALSTFELERVKQINEEKARMLSRRLNDQQQRIMHESAQLEIFRHELSVLQKDLHESHFQNKEVGIIQSEIDEETRDLTRLESEFKSVEQQYLEMKRQIEKKRDRKQQLTQHMSLIISHHETRKANRLNELMMMVSDVSSAASSSSSASSSSQPSDTSSKSALQVKSFTGFAEDELK